MITSRNIEIKSDCGHYEIKAQLVSDASYYTQDTWSSCKSYNGSHWDIVIKKDGKRVKGIQVIDGNYQPFISIESICSHGMKINKTTILMLANATGMFSLALSGIDIQKTRHQYYKDYITARIADGTI